MASRYGAGWVDAGFSATYKALTLNLRPELRYVFHQTTHTQFTEKEVGDVTQSGRLNAPLTLFTNLLVAYSINQRINVFSTYRLGKSRTYENNEGSRFWRDSSRFIVGAGYAFNRYLAVSGSYLFSADPLNREGKIRLPFFETRADYNNRGYAMLSISGSWGPLAKSGSKTKSAMRRPLLQN